MHFGAGQTSESCFRDQICVIVGKYVVDRWMMVLRCDCVGDQGEEGLEVQGLSGWNIDWERIEWRIGYLFTFRYGPFVLLVLRSVVMGCMMDGASF